MNFPVYLDYAATTPVADEVLVAMQDCLGVDGNFGNASARSHVYGWRAEEAVENARIDIAELINADPREIIFTSGATEASNLAVKGYAETKLFSTGGQGLGDEGRPRKLNVVTTHVEHKCVLQACQYLVSRGVELRLVSPNHEGDIDPAAIIRAVDDNTILVSCMHANNETGSVNDIGSLGEALKDTDALFHVDAAQTVGKIPVDVRALNVDLLSLSAHKFYGPKGVGALFVRRHPSVKLAQQIHGGGHERGLRSGTTATHQVVGLGCAAKLAKTKLETDVSHAAALRQRFLGGLEKTSGISVNGTAKTQLPFIVNLAFDGVDGEVMLTSLNKVAVSSGSACMSASIEPSHVLKAMELSDELANSSLRFSFGRYTDEGDVDLAVDSILEAYTRLAKQPLTM